MSNRPGFFSRLAACFDLSKTRRVALAERARLAGAMAKRVICFCCFFVFEHIFIVYFTYYFSLLILNYVRDSTMFKFLCNSGNNFKLYFCSKRETFDSYRCPCWERFFKQFSINFVKWLIIFLVNKKSNYVNHAI